MPYASDKGLSDILLSATLFFDFSLTVKAVPHECVRTGQSTKVKAENEAWFYSKETVSQ